MLDEDNRQLKPDSRQQQPISICDCEIGAILFLLIASPYLLHLYTKCLNCGITYVCLAQDSRRNSVLSDLEIARIKFYG